MDPVGKVDGVRLLRLGKRLTELGREVIARSGATSLTPGEVAVVSDVFRHPGTHVREICARTGFVQSHVSASVARLRERGLLTADPDPVDRRRTRIELTDRAVEAIRDRAGRPAGDVLAQAVADPERARRAAELIEELGELLLPEAGAP
ncbi:MarR family transcriptional regulator [Streptomyces sp. NPDC049577]|uniref:MarR family winged helix-turn-helix transcriptional regulator n=1 Tax=Streptomyces sp. NPDC049577 TaxID=3155153 RepID=UPI00342E1A42